MTLPSICSICRNAKFGDKRLNHRFEFILTILSLKIEHSIPKSFKEWGPIKSVYRFLNNKKVNHQAIIESQFSSWSDLIGKGVYLSIHDTTELNFTGHRSEKQLGSLQYENKKGLFLHNTLICEDNGQPLGVFHQHFWARNPKSLSKKKERKPLPIEEKESNRWIESVARANEFFNQYPLSTIINICDREGDIYELISLPRPSNSHFIIRSCNNRRTKEEDEKIWEQVKKEPVRSRYNIEIFDRQSSKKRIAHLEVKWLENIMLLPPYRRNDKLASVIVSIIYVQEVNPPEGEKPIDWKLLTSLNIETEERALKVIEYYSYRWRIESFHYILKQGCNVESLQLSEEQSLKNAISLYSILACRILTMMYLSRNKPTSPLSIIGFTDQHFFLLKTYLEKNYGFNFHGTMNEPNILNFTHLVGKLGGWLKHNSPHPGIKILWHGLKELQIIISCYEILSEKTYG